MTIAVCIPAHRPRLEDTLAAIDTMAGPDIYFVVVTNEPQPIRAEDVPPEVAVIVDPDPGINLSRWWNYGLRWTQSHGFSSFMVTESDCRMTAENVYRLATALHWGEFGMVGPNLYGALDDDEIQVETQTRDWGERHVGNRICQTWMVKTHDTLYADERYRWWVADEQHEMRHRLIGRGTAIVGSARYAEPLVQTTFPDQVPGLTAAIDEARQLFREEWGFAPLV